MDEPRTMEELKALYVILRKDPQRYLQITNEWIRDNPRNSHAYFSRHDGWMQIGEPRRALQDLNKVIELDPDQMAYFARGDVYRYIGEYRKALDDYQRAEALDPEGWAGNSIGLVHQADCHARLGDEASALAYGARMSETMYMPGLGRPPSGYKPDVLETLRRTAARALQAQSERKTE